MPMRGRGLHPVSTAVRQVEDKVAFGDESLKHAHVVVFSQRFEEELDAIFVGNGSVVSAWTKHDNMAASYIDFMKQDWKDSFRDAAKADDHQSASQ
jgi:hypothetical protein